MAAMTTATPAAAAPETHDGESVRPTKLQGRAFYESIGSPKFVVAPMVDQSEFAWRMLTRSFLTPADNAKTLAYTPMFHARHFHETAGYRDKHFEAVKQPDSATSDAKPSNGEPQECIPFLDGNPAFDRPLFVQFCANEPEHFLKAAQIVAPYCDAVDLNLGCPQGIARKGHYGAFLQEDQDLIYRLINILHENLSIPVTAKFRIQETKEATLAYAKKILSAGASIITVHGRRREQKGHLTGLADWEYIRYLRDNLPPETVIFANGNVLQHGDLEKCLEATGADAIMSAEGNLSDPALFAPPPPEGEEGREYWRGKDGKGGWRLDAVLRRYLDILHKYVLQQEPPARRPLFVVGDDESWLQATEAKDEADTEGPPAKKRKMQAEGDKVRNKKGGKPQNPNLHAVRAHMFHLLRHFVSRHTDIRDALAKAPMGHVPAIEGVLEMIERRIAEGLIEYEKTDGRSIELEPEIKPVKRQLPATMTEAQGQDQGDKKEEDAAQTVSTSENGQTKQTAATAIPASVTDPFESSVATVKACKRPWWVAQPIVRPLPAEALAKGSIQPSKKDKEKAEANKKTES